MKTKLNFLFALIFLVSASVFSQNCGTGDIDLFSQTDVDNFVATYSGTCDTINGNLNIESSDVVDISGLSFLTTILGQVYIYQTSISTLDGLQNITQISNQLIVDQNFSLTTFILPNLATVGLFIKVDNASSITNIDLSSLNSINGSIYFEASTATFSSSANYITLSNLSNLVSADFSGLTDINYFNVFSCANLSILNFTSLLKTDVRFEIFNAPLLTSINIPNLKTIEDYLSVRFSGLTNLDDFSSLRTVKGFVRIRDNSNLVNVDAINNIQVIDSFLEIRDNDLLDECCAVTDFINGPNYISGSLDVSSNGTNCSDVLDIIIYRNENQIDTDVDSIIDSADNCLTVSNPNQEDNDSDGVGDACDNCPDDANATQEDTDSDGIGDACEASGTGADAGLDAGGLGIGTSSPDSQFEIAQGDVFIKNIHRGVIMKSPSGKCFRMQPNDEGILKGTEIT
jgi:hypothetical protein